MLSLRGAGGFGDAIYMYPILKYYLENVPEVEILTNYPEVYKPLKRKGLTITPRYVKRPDRECRYASRYPNQDTTTYQDTLILSGVPGYLPFEMEYHCGNEFVFNTTKKICVIRTPVLPMKGKRGSEPLVPNCEIFQKIIDEFKDRCYFVLAGNTNTFSYKLSGIDLDLTNQLDIPELFQLIDQSDINLAQCGFFVPLAEVLNKKLFVVFAYEAMKRPHKFYHYITPKKVINKTDFVWPCIDSESNKSIVTRFEKLLNLEIKK